MSVPAHRWYASWLTIFKLNKFSFCSAFASNLTGTLGDASLIGFLHGGTFYYNLTSPTLTNETVSAQIVLGNPAEVESNKLISVVTLRGPFSPDSTDYLPASEWEEESDAALFGKFNSSDISSAAVANAEGDVIYDALQLACKQELYVVLESKDTSSEIIYAPLSFVPSKHSEKTCEESVVPYTTTPTTATVEASNGSAPPSSGSAGIKVSMFTVFYLSIFLFV
jgi:hypothetical protein